jgi:uncharacterized protein (TIGR03435 family)
LRADGRLGPGLQPSAIVCDGPGPACGLTNLPGQFAGRGLPIDTLTHALTNWIDGHLQVRDRTGLTGRFDIDLRWSPTQPDIRLPDGAAAPPLDPDGPPLVTAIRDQLGLTLVLVKEALAVLVIDSAAKPAAD